MLFNSIEFAIFLPLTLLAYWLLQGRLKLQNLLLLLASYLFYGWWDWRFLSLIFISSITDYFVGIQLERFQETNKRRSLLGLSILVNIGLLAFFKYYNFFIESFVDAFTLLGNPVNINTLKIILPVGISFYTFQTLSYTIDIYRYNMKPTQDAVAFFAYVSFFPQLVAGPIERAANLLPQFAVKRSVSPENISDGLRQILWGMFKKVVIADNCAVVVDAVFSNPEGYSGMTLIVGVFLFAFQIYGDFSGYSDIAIGTAKLFGFRLMTNFSVPYLSRDIAEFWRRWHISLTTWFRDYLYIPLGGSRVSRSNTIRNVFIIFLVSGFWHGANWTFIFWGAFNAMLFLPLLLSNTNRKHTDIVAEGKMLPSFQESIQVLATFALVCFAWIFFRADTITDSFLYINRIFLGELLVLPDFKSKLVVVVPAILIMMILEWINRSKEHQLDLQRFAFPYRHLIYLFLIALIFFFGKYNSHTFIYFQF